MSGRMVVSVWRLVKTSRIFVRASLPMHGVILSTAFSAAQFTSSLSIISGAELHLVDYVSYLQDSLRSDFGKYKGYVQRNKGFEGQFWA